MILKERGALEGMNLVEIVWFSGGILHQWILSPWEYHTL